VPPPDAVARFVADTVARGPASVSGGLRSRAEAAVDPAGHGRGELAQLVRGVEPGVLAHSNGSCPATWSLTALSSAVRVSAAGIHPGAHLRLCEVPYLVRVT
jgi:hypothetical protein